MAVTVPDTVEIVTSRLLSLLRKADELESQNTIEPPLPSAAFLGELGLPSGSPTDRSHAAVIEVAARRLFHSFLATDDNAQNNFGRIWKLFDILQYIGEQEQCDPVLLWYLIEELLDSQSIEGCRTVFDYLESRRERLVANHFDKIYLVILRACICLLRRISRAEDAVFCGRVFIFVFQTFPLHDKSSINRHGDYNIDNVTAFDNSVDTKPQADDSGGETIMLESSDEKGNDASDVATQPKSSVSNDQLYGAFWAMQESFANPPRTFDPEILSVFKASFALTLEKFKEMRKIMASISSDSRQDRKRRLEETDDMLADVNPKYLTSRELFELELSDLAFQRHILVQGLILLDFLLSHTERSKKKFPLRQQSKIQFTLSEEDTEWALQTKKAIVASLREGQDGLAFARVVETVLSRDRNWARWKEDNCPEIARPSVTAETYSNATRGAKTVCMPKRLKASATGSLDLNFLRESEHTRGVDALSDPTRNTFPTLENLVNKVAIVDMDLEMSSTDDETKQLQQLKASHTWRTLRVGSKTKLNKFSQLSHEPDLNIFVNDGGVVEQGPHNTSEDNQDGNTGEVEDPNDTQNLVSEGKVTSDGSVVTKENVPMETS